MWAQWLASALEWDRTIIANMDETALPYQIPRRHGNALRARQDADANVALHERIGRRASHGHVALVAFLATDETLQAHLPQLVLVKDEQMSRAEETRLAAPSQPVEWMQGANGRVTATNLPAILTRFRRAIRAVRSHRRIVLCMDAASQHLATEVLGHAARLQVQLLLVPAGMTHVLQALDVYVFASLKRRLRDLQHRARGSARDGQLTGMQWIEIMEEGVREVLVDRQWPRAVASCGLTGNTQELRARLCPLVAGQLPLPPTKSCSALQGSAGWA